MRTNISGMQRNIDSGLIINRIKNQYGLKSNADVARFLGITAATLSGWGGERGIGNWELIFAKCKDMDLNFLVWGEYSQNVNEVVAVVSEPMAQYNKCSECNKKDKMIDRLERENERLLKYIDKIEGENQTKVANCG